MKFTYLRYFNKIVKTSVRFRHYHPATVIVTTSILFPLILKWMAITVSAIACPAGVVVLPLTKLRIKPGSISCINPCLYIYQ